MILTDNDVRVFVNNGNLMLHGEKPIDSLLASPDTAILYADEKNITNIGYDLTTKAFSESGEEQETIVLAPGSSVIVYSEEIIHFDSVTCGKVNIKNSRMRMGLFVTSPVYQPGHTTRIYFRLTNMSDKEITVCKGQQYAMLIFEQLDHAPEKPYSGTFSDEYEKYKGLSEYSSAYEPQIQEIEKKKEDLHALESRIYGNVVTILTVFIAIFTILNMNITLAKDASKPINFILYNLSVLGGIGFLSALLDEILNRNKKHRLWLIPIISFAVLIILLLLL